MPSKRTAVAAAAALLSMGGAVADQPIYTVKSAYAAVANETNGLPQQRFRSSDIIAPVLQVNTWDKTQTDDSSYLFLSGAYGRHKAAPMILSGKDLSLVYADQQYDEVYASSVQTLNGTQYLTFWEGPRRGGNSSRADGHWLMYDGTYALQFNLTARGSGAIRDDMPAMRVTRDNTVLLPLYETVTADCSAVGGPVDAPLQDSGFQEMDPATNKVVFEWRAREHFDLNASFAQYDAAFGVGSPGGFDFFHLDSVEKADNGHYLVSSSHFSMLAMVDGQDGHVLWTLGGKHSDFRDVYDGGNATDFAWQRDVRMTGPDEITLFDNHVRSTDHCRGPCHSRGLRLRLDHAARTVALVAEWRHPDDGGGGVDAGRMGGVQLLGDGHAVVAWGDNPAFVEYNKAGQPVLDVQRGVAGAAAGRLERVSRQRWHGAPSWPPSVAVDAPSKSTSGATVYVSWNGATEVAAWAILASDTADTVSHYKNVIAHANRTGFETHIALDDAVARRYIGAAAMSAAGDVLGASFVYDMHTGKAVMQASGITTIRPPVKATAAAGAMGGSIFGFSMLFYIGNYFWRKRGAAPSAEEHPSYEKVGGGSAV
ncbi:hypothetical protein CCM_02692 [Cordyceps militaris CM01]|uniref:Arylsulfotransferase n=1 Tax=Cordyceps militaris (strain CM01) TaxID=983644 RepID=G3JB61_CORMM|nr:uncharacterized protein CCM_02692 [Cordyceps militaris CM01]EGX94421.1 hypothetical protein CCM_02692 [Cordyceps militaris CM01]